MGGKVILTLTFVLVEERGEEFRAVSVARLLFYTMHSIMEGCGSGRKS